MYNIGVISLRMWMSLNRYFNHTMIIILLYFMRYKLWLLLSDYVEILTIKIIKQILISYKCLKDIIN